MKSFREVINGHTYHVTCSWRHCWVTATLHEDGVAVVRKREFAVFPGGSSYQPRFLRISFEGVTALVSLDDTLMAKSCKWSLADGTTEK